MANKKVRIFVYGDGMHVCSETARASAQRVEEVDRQRTLYHQNIKNAKERRELAAEVRNSIGAFEVKLRATQRDLKHQDDDDDDDV